MTFKTIVMICGVFCCFLTAQSQTDSVYYNTEWKMGKLYRHDPTGIPNLQNQGLQINDHPRIDVRDPDAPEAPPSYQNHSSLKASQVNGTVVGIGRNFEGNHLYGVTPADNAIAISDSGLIVSMDNSTISYFKDNGDTIVKYGIPIVNWYKDSTFNQQPFDPRLIYDRVEDRFIAVMIYFSQDYTDSRILVSFSQPLSLDSVAWNHYQINLGDIYTDPSEANYWGDFPSIGINNEELFICMNIFERFNANDSSSFENSLVLQIEKAPGYAGAAQLNCKEWKDIENTDGIDAFSMVPAGDAFQSSGYGPGCYFVSNYARNSTKFFWYELTGDINDPNAMIVSHLIATSFFYDYPSFATQLGSNGKDRISFSDCSILTAIYQNGNIHFVFHHSDMGWGELVYAKINLANNSFFYDTWGGAEESLNSMYPSMAPFGSDSTDEIFMIAFQRTGPTIYPEICVINYDSGWSPAATVVHPGLGILDRRRDIIAPWDTLERIGDYTAIQRRFNDPNNACWLAGAYASGPSPNHFGVVDGMITWIAEVGDTLNVGLVEQSVSQSFIMFPNPLKENFEYLSIQLPHGPQKGNIRIVNLKGDTVLDTKFSGLSFSVKMPSLPDGLYFVQIASNKYNYESQTLLIHN